VFGAAGSQRQLLVGDLGMQLGHPGAKDSPECSLGVELIGLVFPQALGERLLGRVTVRGDHVLAPTVRSDQVDGAPVREGGNGQAGHITQRLLVVQRRGENQARFGEHTSSHLGGLDRGHVLDHGDRAEEVTLPVVQRRCLEQVPAHFPRGAADCPHQQGGRRFVAREL
jgi:hypothetical protein